MNNGIFNINTNYIQSIFKYGNSFPSSITTPGNINNSIDWRIVGPQFWSRWKQILNTFIGNISFDYKPYTVKSTFPGGTNPYLSGIMMENGNIFFVPFNATAGQIYDPINDRIITPTGSYPGSAAYSGAVLIHSGEVLLVPRNTVCRVYNPYSDSVRTIGSAPAVANAFYSGVVLPDGRVYCVAGGSSFAQIIDPKLNTVTALPGSPATGAVGAVLLPDGRILVVPNGVPNSPAVIYNPITNTHTSTSLNPPVNTAYFGGVIMPDDDIFIIPNSATSAVIYNYKKDTVTTIPGTVTGYSSAVLLPDGGVFLMSATANTAHKIYYRETNSYITLNTAPTTNNECLGCTILQDGRVFMFPRNVTSGGGYGSKTNVTFPIDLMLSAYFSKR